MSWCDVTTSWRDVTWRTSWRDVMWHDGMTSDDVYSWQNVQRFNPSETSEITFFNLVTLTFDLWPWPSNSFEILWRSMPPPNFGSLCQTFQLWERSQTGAHTHTDRTDSIPSTADAGGKNAMRSDTKWIFNMSMKNKSIGHHHICDFWWSDTRQHFNCICLKTGLNSVPGKARRDYPKKFSSPLPQIDSPPPGKNDSSLTSNLYCRQHQTFHPLTM